MRSSVFSTFLMLAAMLLGGVWPAVHARAEAPGEALASDDASDVPAFFQVQPLEEDAVGISDVPTADATVPAAYQTQPPEEAALGIRGLQAGEAAAPEQPSCGGCGPYQEIIADACDRFSRLGLGCACWSFSADALALQRTNTRNQPLLQNSQEVDLLNSQHLNFPVEMGFQVGAVRRGPCGWELELGYFQIDGWEANAFVPGLSYMATDVHGANFVVSNAQVRYTSALHFGEINLRREWFDGLTLLAGFRMGELDELYSNHALGARVPVPVTLDAQTFNHLYGFQLGAAYEFYNMGGPLRVSALCKAGIYGNWASQRIRQIDTGFTDETLDASDNQAAFMGETGLLATYQITRCLALRASYSAVWLEGVALAPEQISSTDFTAGTADINTHGSLFYHGGGLGLELRF